MEKITFNGVGKTHVIENRSFDEFHGITLAIITMNEEEDIAEFLSHIRPHVDKIVMVDGGSTDKTVEIAAPLVDTLKIVPYTGHLGNQKNISISLSMTDWTLFLDPDERLTSKAISSLKGMINQDTFDCYSFPRREFLSGVENKDPFPDYQDRLFRTYCRYIRPVHHELVGYKNKNKVPVDQGVEIIHSKRSERHTERNIGHFVYENKFKNELSYPGCQMKGTWAKRFPEFCKSLKSNEML